LRNIKRFSKFDLIAHDNFVAIGLGALFLRGSNFAIFLSPGSRCWHSADAITQHV